ncbi:MAG: hypothetical protein IJ800_05230 [Clostridia bacterium]|nr:hypothetical protein [Clostridia bacterium]
MQNEKLIEKLSSKYSFVRISAYNKLLKSHEFKQNTLSENFNVNYHVRTIYSCSGRTPSLAVYGALKQGAPMLAVIDHSSLSATEELQKTAEKSGIAYYSGAEVTLFSENFAPKPFIAVALGVPRANAFVFNEKLASYRALKSAYVKKLSDKINNIFKKYGIKTEMPAKIPFGGAKATMTRRRLFFILAEQIINKYDDGEKVVAFLTNDLRLELDRETINKLDDFANPLYVSDLADVLLNNLKIKTDDEKCHTIKQFISLCSDYSALPAIVYDGSDIRQFVEKATKAGFRSIITRTEKGADELYSASIENGVLPLFCKVISTPRDKFDFEFEDAGLAAKYNECAFAVVGHEIATAIDASDGIFSEEQISKSPDIADRIKLFSRIGAKGTLLNE